MTEAAGSVIVEIGGDSGPLEAKLAQIKTLLDKFDKSANRSTAPLGGVGTNSQKAAAGVAALNAAANNVQASLHGMNSRLGVAGSALEALGTKGVAAGAAIVAVGIAIKASVAAFAEAEKVQLRLGAVLKATGESAGLTKQQILDYSSALQDSLKINDEKIVEASTILATFRAVSGDTFKEAISLAGDLSSVFGSDISSSARQMGLALQDPLTGMGALRRAGVTFTATQKEMVKQMLAVGNTAGAQRIVLDELQRQVGGVGATAASGLSGSMDGLVNQWDDFLEALGKTPAIVRAVGGAFGWLSGFLKTVSSAIAPTIEEQIDQLQKRVDNLKTTPSFFQPSDKKKKELEEQLANLKGMQLLLKRQEQINRDRAAAGAEEAKAQAEEDRLAGIALDMKPYIEKAKGLLDVARAFAISEEAGNKATLAMAAHTEALSKASLSEKELLAIMTESAAAENAARVSQETDALQDRVKEAEKLLIASRQGIDASQDASAALEIETFKRKALLGATAATIEQINAEVAAYSEATMKLLEHNRAMEEEKRIRDANSNLSIEKMRTALAIETDPERVNAGRLAIERQLKINQLMEQYGNLTAAAAVEELKLFDKTQELKEIQRFWDEVKRKAEDISNDISGFLVDGLVNAAEGGKSTFDDMFDAALASGKRFVARLAVEILKQKFILPITTAIVGSTSSLFGIAGGGSASSGGGGGSSAMAGANLGASALGVAAGPSAMLSNSIINFGLSSGAFGVGTGQAIAAAVPYVGAFVAAVGLAKSIGLFDKKSVGANASGFISESGGQFSIGGIGEDRNKGASQLATVQGILDGTLGVLNNFIKAAGLLDKQVGDGVREAVQLFASGKDPINTSVESLAKSLVPYIEGLTEAQRATIGASTSLDGFTTVLNEIIEANRFPLEIAAQRKQLEDPRGFAIDELENFRNTSIAFAQTLDNNAQVLADIEAIYRFKLKAINEQFSEFIDVFATLVENHKGALLAVDAAAAVLFKAIDKQRDSISEAYQKKVNETQKSIKSITDSVSKLTSLSGTLKSALSFFNSQEPLTTSSRGGAQATIRDMLEAARSGGTMPDQEKLVDAIETLKRPSEDLFKTFQDYQLDFARTKNDISELSDRASWQLNSAERQLETLNAMAAQDQLAYDGQIKALDDQVALAQQQIEEIKGTTIAVMSVEQAIKNLAAASNSARQSGGSVSAITKPVAELYQNLLGREPDKAGEAFYNNEIARGAATTKDVAISMVSSPEFLASNPTVESLYQILLGRAPDADGLAYWKAAESAGMSLGEIAANFVRDTEYSNIAAIRGYASGGVHAGGYRKVGEGFRPEIEWTPPSLIISSTNSKQMVDNSGVIAAIMSLSNEMSNLQQSIDVTARSTKRTSDLLIRVTRDGESLLTTAA